MFCPLTHRWTEQIRRLKCFPSSYFPSRLQWLFPLCQFHKPLHQEVFCNVNGQHSSCTPKVQNIANTICKIKLWLIGIQETFQDTKRLIRTCNSKDRQYRQKDNVTEFVARLTRWVPLVEQELRTLPEHLSSSSVTAQQRRPRGTID